MFLIYKDTDQQWILLLCSGSIKKKHAFATFEDAEQAAEFLGLRVYIETGDVLFLSA